MKRGKLSGSADLPQYLVGTVANFVSSVATPKPAPAAGSVAAITVSLAAALCVKSALLSVRQLQNANTLATTAQELSNRAGELCQSDAQAYAEVIVAQREKRRQDSPDTVARVKASLEGAAQISLDIANIGVEVGAIAAHLAEAGNANLVGDSITAALLAESAVQSATTLARINLESAEREPHSDRIAQLLGLAASYRTKALESITGRLPL
ncbi:cyclodeaminase/cyclohydrolase family protein [Ferrimicrobium sp.]|uniref:cyclodeaminase/cyclohydrolase family protein n=1 Tax=Ferrimicrobium sp. TaxID=2926050 RepID=UPI002616AEE1|nr:cyclodeaminase/cyclohydrolase family protein [Ferrimicrobium sp.]